MRGVVGLSFVRSSVRRAPSPSARSGCGCWWAASLPSPCARHRPSPASCTRSCRWIHPQWVPRPGATENVKCRRHARSSGLWPIEGKDDACVSLRKDRCFLSPEPRFYPLGQMFAFSRVRASSLQIRAFEDSAVCRVVRYELLVTRYGLFFQPPEDLTAVDFWVLEHGPSLFPPRLALSSRT